MKKLFPDYLNSLGLQNEAGDVLELDRDGNGSFKEHVKKYVLLSAQKEIDKGSDLSCMVWLNIQDGKAVSFDWNKFVQFRTRMKAAPAFDSIEISTPENELFGTADIQYRHFTKFSHEHSAVNGELAEAHLVKMLNPMNYIADENADTAKHFRIRHGAVDMDTSLAISAMLTAKLRNNGANVDYHLPWGLPHSGDYDLEELFAWIDNICKSGGNM